MTTSKPARTVSRRAALAGLGAGGVGLALAATARHTAAQDAATEMANHPLVGTWLAGRAPNDISVAHWGPDGSMTTNLPTVGTGADGAITHSDPALGSWVPESARGIHFVFTNRTYDATGALTGTFTVEGHPVASEDGLSFWDDAVEATVTIRDPNGVVVQILRRGRLRPPHRRRAARARPVRLRRDAGHARGPAGRHAGGRHPDLLTTATTDRGNGPGSPPGPLCYPRTQGLETTLDDDRKR